MKNAPKPKPKPKPKFLLCFRPVVDMDMGLEGKGVRAVGNKEGKNGKKTSSLTKTMSVDKDCSSVNSENSNLPPRPNKTFSRVIKAVVFETILAKKVRDQKGYRQDSFGSNSKRSFSMRSESSLNLGTDELMKIEEIKPSLKKSHSSSSRFSSSSSLSRSNSVLDAKNLSRILSDSTKESIRKHQDPAVKTAKSKNMEIGSSCFNSGVCFLLISLAMTVFWGRVLAILVSSIWLYFLPWRSPSNRRPGKVRRWSEAECRDNNRRVIMEGLIERNHHHRDRGH